MNNPKHTFLNYLSSLPKNACYLALHSITCLEDNYSKLYSQDLVSHYPNTALEYCGNYTKSIVIVENVNLLGIHIPEGCVFYNFEKKVIFGKVETSSSSLLLHHYGQIFAPKRWNYCPAIYLAKNSKIIVW
jgi:hypothetical protein